MRKKLIGKKDFGGVIDITDPCYNKDVWCRITAIIKQGEYYCYIWNNTDKYMYEGKEIKDIRVGIIGIYLNGNIPSQKDMQKIGEIGVDAGLAGFFMNKPDYDDAQWTDFCSFIKSGSAWIRDEGFFSHSGYGDGVYDVYSYVKNGEITALEIRFM